MVLQKEITFYLNRSSGHLIKSLFKAKYTPDRAIIPKRIISLATIFLTLQQWSCTLVAAGTPAPYYGEGALAALGTRAAARCPGAICFGGMGCVIIAGPRLSGLFRSLQPALGHI